MGVCLCRWMVQFMENLKIPWRITGGSTILGNTQMGSFCWFCAFLFFQCDYFKLDMFWIQDAICFIGLCSTCSATDIAMVALVVLYSTVQLLFVNQCHHCHFNLGAAIICTDIVVFLSQIGQISLSTDIAHRFSVMARLVLSTLHLWCQTS